MEIKYTRIQDKIEFKFEGDTLKLREYFPKTDTYVYERFNEVGNLVCFEVVRPRYIKQDGERIGVYPSSEQWGRLGLTIDNNWFAEEYIKFLVSTKDWSPENRHNFKKTLRCAES